VQDEYVDLERQNARIFSNHLVGLVQSLLELRSSIEVDQAMQQFASKYCQGVYSGAQPGDGSIPLTPITIINADGIYLATYSALLLNLKLIHQGYYQDPSKAVPSTEDQFVEDVHGSGVLVYLSSAWLSELYQQTLATSLLEKCGHHPSNNTKNIALINLLTG